MGSATLDFTAAGYRKWARDPNIESGLGCGGRSVVTLFIASSPSSSDRTTKANEKAKVVRFVPGLTAESATHRP